MRAEIKINKAIKNGGREPKYFEKSTHFYYKDESNIYKQPPPFMLREIPMYKFWDTIKMQTTTTTTYCCVEIWGNNRVDK
jgi:hypothetical protein